MAGFFGSSDDATPSKDERSYVENVVSDIANLNKYANASFVGDRQTMIECFNAISWGDKQVKENIRKYCEADHAERQLIDDVYKVVCPYFDKVQGPTFNTMSLWLKSRLHMQHQKEPFNPVHT